MKIIIFNTLYSPYRVGGAELSVQFLAEGLAQKKHEVTVVTLHEKDDVDISVENKVRIIRMPLENIYWVNSNNQSAVKKCIWHFSDIYNNRMKKLVSHTLIDESFDIVHTNNLCGFSVAVWDWAVGNKIPIVHTTRDYYLMNPNSKLYRRGNNHSPNTIDSLFFSILKKIKSQKVTSFVGISNYIKNIHVENGFFKNSKNYVVYNGISSPTGDILLEGKTKKTNDIIVGYLGRVESSKGIEILLQAIQEKEEQSILIKVAGKGGSDYLKYLQSKYSKLKVEFLGSVNIADFFPQIDFLVVPSMWNEPFGRVVIEANSYGVPVIGSNRGGIPEIIIENETGFIFNSEQASSLSDVVDRIQKMDIREYELMKIRCKSHSYKFKSDLITDNYLNVYEETLKEVCK